MKHKGRILIVVALIVICIIGVYRAWQQLVFYRSIPQQTTRLRSESFVQLCSGLEPTNEQTFLLSRANCLGRIRGYTDSHIHTVKMLQQTYLIPQTSQLWCVPKKKTDNELLTDVLHWADNNPSEYDSVVSVYAGTAGAMAVLAAALHTSYPCTK